MMAYQVKFVGLLCFTVRTPIHVGGFREANVLYTLKLAGSPLIPSTTWKGTFRALAERLAPTMRMSEVERLAVEKVAFSKNSRESVRDLVDAFLKALQGTACPPFDPADVRRVLLNLGYREEELAALEDPAWALTEYLAYYCPIGRLFGNIARAGSVRFLDTLLPPAVQRRPGVGIDRKTLTAKEGVLYQVETTRAGIEVPLVIVGEVDELGSTAARLLASILETVSEVGLSIGGRKSAGLGLLELGKAEFHVVKPAEDKGGLGLANPLKSPAISLQDFAKLLRGD